MLLLKVSFCVLFKQLPDTYLDLKSWQSYSNSLTSSNYSFHFHMFFCPMQEALLRIYCNETAGLGDCHFSLCQTLCSPAVHSLKSWFSEFFFKPQNKKTKNSTAPLSFLACFFQYQAEWHLEKVPLNSLTSHILILELSLKHRAIFTNTLKRLISFLLLKSFPF